MIKKPEQKWLKRLDGIEKVLGLDKDKDKRKRKNNDR